jgi:hypothetical protein
VIRDALPYSGKAYLSISSRCFGLGNCKDLSSPWYVKSPFSAVPSVKAYRIHSNDDFVVLGCSVFWKTESPQETIDHIHALLKHSGLTAYAIVDELLERSIAKHGHFSGYGIGSISLSVVLLHDKYRP